MIYSRIIGTGSYLPEKVVSNFDLEKIVDTSDEWIVERTGIRNRHIIAEGETTSSMAILAAQRALQAANVTANEIDLVIIGTCTPDRMFPSTACLVQDALGIKKNIPAFDVSAACAGFIYALSICDQFIKSGMVKKALAIGSESLSRVVDWSDRKTCVLFGDGAGAVVLQASDEPGIHSTHLHAQGSYKHLLYLANDPAAPHLKAETSFVHMNGGGVFKLAVVELGNVVDEALAANNFAKSQIDWLVPHQANLRIIKSLAKRLDLPLEKVILTIQEHGNTSSASIPLALDQGIRDGRIKKGHKVLMEAIGGGMAWGSAIFTY
jgi:3-oxoacyl-[acyl-carrier-protein] synthase III